MNHRNPEKDCLAYENMLQTVRLTLLDGFAHDEPDITAKLKGLALAAPTLFSGLLPRDGLGAHAEDEDDPSVGARVIGDTSHPDASVLVLVKASVYKAMGFPVREGELSPAFALLLRDAYQTDFGKNIVVTSNWQVKWWKKVSFGDRYVSTVSNCGVKAVLFRHTR